MTNALPQTTPFQSDKEQDDKLGGQTTSFGVPGQALEADRSAEIIPDDTDREVAFDLTVQDAPTPTISSSAVALNVGTKKYSVQADNLKAELQARQQNLQFSISDLEVQISDVDSRFIERSKVLEDNYKADLASLTDEHDKFHANLQAQLDDHTSALAMVQKGLADA